MTPRPYRAPSDQPALLELIGSAYADFGVPFNPDAPEEAHLLEVDALRSRGGELWVIPATDRLLGSIALHLDPADPSTGEIKTVYVHREARRRGVGGRLMTVATEAARAAGVTRLILWSDTRFSAAHAFYERLGYRRLDEIRHTDGWDTFDEIGFEMPL